MPVLLPDTSAAEDMDPSVAGTYPARSVKCEGAVTKEKKVPQAVIQFQLTGVPREDNNEQRDIKRTVWLNIEGAGSMGFDQYLRAIGMKDVADRIRNGERVPIDTDDLINKDLMVILKIGTYNDRRRDEVAGFLPA